MVLDALPPDAQRWNHNIEYERLVLRQMPRNASNALDVGCGEGHQARALATLCQSVTGIDPDSESIELARTQHPAGHYLEADFLAHDFGGQRFDLISASAALHHMDTRAALAKMRDLLRPGGRIVVIGCARHDSFLERLQWEARALLSHNVLHRRDRAREWQHPSPVLWPPPQTLGEVRRVAAEVIPGASIRWLPLWRYELVWPGR